MKTQCKLAGLPVAFMHESERVAQFFSDFVTAEHPTLTLSVTRAEIDAEYTAERPIADRAALRADRGYGEALALYRRFCHTLPTYGGFFLHAAFFTYRNHGVAVIAPSGVGKSTHVRLWREAYPDEVRVINGDKPLVRRTADGDYLGYGAPLAGKEGWCEHTAAPITHLIFLTRGTEDTVAPLPPAEAFPSLFSAVLAPQDQQELSLLLPHISNILQSARTYRAAVTPSPMAVDAVRRAILEG